MTYLVGIVNGSLPVCLHPVCCVADMHISSLWIQTGSDQIAKSPSHVYRISFHDIEIVCEAWAVPFMLQLPCNCIDFSRLFRY